MELARALYDAGEYREALSELEKVLRTDNTDAGAQFGAGRCHLALGELETAAKCFREVISLQRSYQDYAAWLDLADVLHQTGCGKEAVETLRELHRMSPRMDHTLRLARLLHEYDQIEEAIEELQRALLDYEHAPKHVRRSTKADARTARQLLAQLS